MEEQSDMITSWAADAANKVPGLGEEGDRQFFISLSFYSQMEPLEATMSLNYI